LYWRRNLSTPYHVDYCFVPTNWASTSKVAVGTATDWLDKSDHMPLIVDVEPQTTRTS
jgi:endonuclease/exonuclease/phosphatase family metal-dependent hydrolase